ncbi:MAG: toll/interleukin-1 receptor domain-containing protein [Candidatus Acidiferrales bacterium]
MAFDVFISYASKDKIVADAVCARLEAAGIRCWIAPRDIIPGRSYGEAIIEAIHGAQVMVLVFSSNANASAHIPKEVERAMSRGVTILPFRIEDIAPGKSLDYFIGSVHWLDAMTPPMEKHLDDLAATVHKLIPAKGHEEAPMPLGTGVWQSSGAGSAAAASGRSVTISQTAQTAPASLSKSKIWMVAAAVIVIAAVAIGIVVHHSNVPVPDGPTVVNPPDTKDVPSDSNPPDKPAPNPKTNPPSHKASSAPVVNVSTDPPVGCYQWFNNAPVEIRADGTMTAGPFLGHWRVVDAARHAYTFTWPDNIETLTITPDQRSMSGSNQYGYPMAGGRLTGTVGMPGTWKWTNGYVVNISSNGAFTSGSFRGSWRAVDASRGIYEMTWPKPVDSVTLTSGGTRIAGSNQYGVAISGVKTGVCGGS